MDKYKYIESIAQKIHNGDALSDMELEIGLEFYKDLELKLIALGPIFHLACNEVGRIKRELQGYSNARAERAERF